MRMHHVGTLVLRDWNTPRRRYVIDADSGSVLSREAATSISSPVAGVAKKHLGRRMTLVYKRDHAGGTELVVRSGETCIPISGRDCDADLSTNLVGVTKLHIRCASGSVTVREVNATLWLISRIDPAYDRSDRESEHFISWLYHLVRSEETQDHLLNTWR